MFDINLLKECIRNLPPIDITSCTNRWWKYRSGIRREIITLNVNKFLSFPTIRETMYVGGEFSYYKHELNLYNKSRYKDFNIKDSHVGSPIINSNTGLSYDLTHQLNYIVEYNNITNKRPEEFKSIIEFGGGFGLLRYLFKQLGFSGLYTIYDFPELCFLQKYYLEQNNIFDTKFIPIEGTSTFRPKRADLLIGIYSISESSIEQRIKLLDSIQTDSYLIAFQKTFDDLNNEEFFKNYFKVDEIKYLESHAKGSLETRYIFR